jgi:hypothetical protein
MNEQTKELLNEEEMLETVIELEDFEHFELSKLCIGPNDTL